MIKPIHTEPRPYCPKCGATMELRQPRPGQSHFEPFWSCQNFPDCKGTRDIDKYGKPIIDEEAV